MCVDDKVSKLFKTYLGKDALYNFIISMIEECKYCGDLMKKDFNKELVMTKEDNEDFKNSTRCWTCDDDYVDNDVKARGHCHMIKKYRGFPHRDCILNLNQFNIHLHGFVSLHSQS